MRRLIALLALLPCLLAPTVNAGAMNDYVYYEQMRPLIHAAANQWGISESWLTCQLHAENRDFDPNAISDTQDYGVGQWHRWPDGEFKSFNDTAYRGQSPLDPAAAIGATAWTLAVGMGPNTYRATYWRCV